jgi:hypothetical protein
LTLLFFVFIPFCHVIFLSGKEFGQVFYCLYITCVAEGGFGDAGLGFAFSVRTSVPARQYLLSVICNSNSFQSILFKLCTVFVYILRMCTSYYGLIWRFFSYIFCMPNLVIFYHYMSWMVPSWCNLKLQQCSINIIQTLHSVCIHIEDYGLIWRFFSYSFCMLNLVIFYHYMALTVPSWCNLKL